MDCRTYRQEQTITAAEQTERLYGEKVPEGYVLEVLHMSISDETTGNKVLRLGYRTVADVDKVLEAAKGSQLYECHLNGHAWIEAGEKPYGEVVSATANNVINFSCHGKLWPRK